MSCIIIYFSRKGTTKAAADEISRQLNCDTFRLMPAKRYSRLFIKCLIRAYRDKKKMRYPGLQGSKINFKLYDTIVLGFPVWLGTFPRIISTFLHTYKLAGKRIVPFCTCRRGEGTCFDDLSKEFKDYTWQGGSMFMSKKTLKEDAASFISRNELTKPYKETAPHKPKPKKSPYRK